MAVEWETLPGPGEFLRQLHSDLLEGASVLLEVPQKLPLPVAEFLSCRLHSRFRWTPLTVTADRPINCVRHALADKSRATLTSPEKLYEIEGFDSRIFYLNELEQQQIPVWIDFLIEFAHVNTMQNLLERSAFVLRLPSGASVQCKEDLLLVHRRWDDVVDATDALLMAHRAIRSSAGTSSPLQRDLKATLCVELAQWDMDLCESLSHQHITTLLQPSAILTKHARDMGWDAVHLDVSEPRLWECGIMQTFGGHKRLHHGWHALHEEHDELRAAVWRAELKVLFPFAEEQRLKVIRRYRRFLHIPHKRKDGTILSELSDFELSDIDFQFWSNTNVPRRLRDFVHDLWLLRNSLAHQMCLEPRLVSPKVLDTDADTLA